MDKREKSDFESIRLRVYGIVQGVGFRPFTARLAQRHGITGLIRNMGGLVEITATGSRESLAAFTGELLAHPPINSLIVHHEINSIWTEGFSAFTIGASEDAQGLVFISPDLPVCEDCLGEMSDPNDERYRYPLISCMSCGPRYSIIEDAPYDRETTTMRDFAMCPVCDAEYRDKGDRRYHAQTISCHDCGPQMIFNRNGGETERETAIEEAARVLNGGGVIAVKGIGGYHLVCSPYAQDAVLRLRALKRREQKPFAVMFPDMDQISEQCRVSGYESALLRSNARPIVLLEKKDSRLAPAVCNKSRHIGAFLPYTPLQTMLLKECGPLVMTSANISEEPIIRQDTDMLAWDGLDGVLYHPRRISVSLDDSVVKAAGNRTQVIRRSRGYAPLPVIIRGVDEGCGSVYAAGGQLKSAFCLTSGPFAYMSQHIGDLDNEGCMAEYTDSFTRMKRVFRIEPKLAVCDGHPGYISAEFSKNLGLPVLEAQHHHAHIASVMAEHGIEMPVIGVAFDGTGYGTDGAVWGAEFLVCHGSDFRRVGHLKYVPGIGADESMRDAGKSAMFHLYAAGLEEHIRDERWPIMRAALCSGMGVYQSSSMGRLFDAASALLGICTYNRFEGECAIDLENLAAEAIEHNIRPAAMAFDIKEKDGVLLADASPVIEKLMSGRGNDPRAFTLGFHRAVADMALAICCRIRDDTGIGDVALSGGVFQNSVLLDGLMKGLKADGFSVYINESVPPNDGGICLGQAYIGLQHLRGKESACV